MKLNFSPVFPFLLFGQQRVAKWKELGFLANCQLPIASCLFSKTPHRIAAPRWEGNGLLYHLFASASNKKFTLWKAAEVVEQSENTGAYVAPPPSAVDRA
jgi:hypothetical protein